MNSPENKTNRLGRILAIAAALLVLVGASSEHFFLEECPQETVSQKTEVSLARREERSTTESVNSLNWPRKAGAATRSGLISVDLGVNNRSERQSLNGIGTYLII